MTDRCEFYYVMASQDLRSAPYPVFECFIPKYHTVFNECGYVFYSSKRNYTKIYKSSLSKKTSKRLNKLAKLKKEYEDGLEKIKNTISDIVIKVKPRYDELYSRYDNFKIIRSKIKQKNKDSFTQLIIFIDHPINNYYYFYGIVQNPVILIDNMTEQFRMHICVIDHYCVIYYILCVNPIKYVIGILDL
jgi:hypothetical protein